MHYEHTHTHIDTVHRTYADTVRYTNTVTHILIQSNAVFLILRTVMHKVLYFSFWKQSVTYTVKCCSYPEDSPSCMSICVYWCVGLAEKEEDVEPERKAKARWWKQPRLLLESHSAQAPTRIRTSPWCHSEFPDWCRPGWSNQKTRSPGIRTQNKYI